MQASSFMAQFTHPDSIGESEYRAVYETLLDGLESNEEQTEEAHHALAVSMLLQFESAAASMRLQLRTAREK